MEKNYRQIEFGWGNIDDAVQELNEYKQKGELVFGMFNGIKLYSDVDDFDSAYKKITGQTKAEFDEAIRKRQEEYRKEEELHKEAIPKLTLEWIEKGHKILDKQYHELWEKCVPVRLGDLYRGMELGMCLDIVKELNDGCCLEHAKEIIEGQGHSGMSFGLICSMIKSFCDRGAEFVEFVK